MKRFHIKLTGMKKYRGDICPNAQETLEKAKYESRNYFCTPAGQMKYEVHYYSTSSVVDLSTRSCSYKVWDLTGIPYKHAVSTIYTNREKP